MSTRLRQNGLYIIEDWSRDHEIEERIASLALSDPEGEVVQKISAAQADPGFEHEYSMPLSMLICQLLIAAGRNPELIKAISIIDGYCEIQRGKALIEPGTPISSYIGELGAWMFDKEPG